jgi:monoterpene epsilon-lactone hydrolase
MYGGIVAALPTDRPPTIEDLRAAFGAMFEKFTLPDDAETNPVDAGGVPAVWVQAPGTADDRVLIHLHGGGFCLGSAAGYLPFGYQLSRAVDGRVLLVDFRLAPEHPFPAAIDDAMTAYRHVLQSGVIPGRILISGDSAGGALAVGVTLAVRDGGEPLPAGLVLFSPLLDLAGESESMTTRAALDPVVSPELISNLGGAYLAGRDPKQTPLASPLHADLGGLPPAQVFVGTAEAVHDDSTRFADQVSGAGGRVELVVGEDMIHVYPIFSEFLPEGREALGQLRAFADRVIQPSPTAVPVR